MNNPLLPKDASDTQLQCFVLLSAFVAGKNAAVQQLKLNNFLAVIQAATDFEQLTPFKALQELRRRHGDAVVRQLLEKCKVGQYTRLTKTILTLLDAEWDLRNCTREQLASVPGISFKTASFFIIYSRRDTTMACLDVHILRWMRESPHFPDNIPKNSPGNVKHYLQLEQLFLDYCQQERKIPYELDFALWSASRQIPTALKND